VVQVQFSRLIRELGWRTAMLRGRARRIARSRR
jgi:hypothetical protein